MRRRVVVTGLGLISPVGSTVDSAWANVLAGRSGIQALRDEAYAAYPTRFAGLVSGFRAENWLGAKEIRKTDPFIHYGVAAAKQAVADAGLDLDGALAERTGVCIGSGIGGLGSIEQECAALARGGVRKVSPFFIPSAIIKMISGYVSIELGITGPNLAAVTACTTGTHARRCWGASMWS